MKWPQLGDFGWPPGLLGREINPTVYAPAEFAKKRMAKDHFLTEVLTKPRLLVLGKADELDEAAR